MVNLISRNVVVVVVRNDVNDLAKKVSVLFRPFKFIGVFDYS